MSAFFDHGDAAKDDLDPDLKVNPVVMARLEMERAKAGAAQPKKGWYPGKAGPLAKLGFRISHRAPAKGKGGKGTREERQSITQMPGAKVMKGIDVMIKQENARAEA